jgi:putative transposase
MLLQSGPMYERTFFVTTVTYGRKLLFRSASMAGLFMETMYQYRDQGKFLLHEFVLMPDHLHLILTPAPTISLERCAQFLKGGFSFRCSQHLGAKQEVWQPGFENHRIQDDRDYETHRTYIHMNPVRARLCSRPSDYPYSSAHPQFELDIPHRGESRCILGILNARLKPCSSTLVPTFLYNLGPTSESAYNAITV